MEKQNKIVSNAIGPIGIEAKTTIQKLQKSDGNEEQGEKRPREVGSGTIWSFDARFEKVGEMAMKSKKMGSNYASQQMQKQNKNPQAAIKKNKKKVPDCLGWSKKKKRLVNGLHSLWRKFSFVQKCRNTRYHRTRKLNEKYIL